MGWASARRGRSAAMAGGRFFLLSSACTSAGIDTPAPTAREPVCRNWRREIMKPPGNDAHYIDWRVQRLIRLASTALEWIHGQRLCLRRVRGMERDYSG